jgi:isochorismate synthase
MSRYWLAARAPDVEPLDLLRLAGERGVGRFYYASRDGWEVCGLGEAAVLASEGPGRYQQLAAEAEAAVASLSFVGPANMDHRWLPQFVGGFAFAPDWQWQAGSPWVGFRGARLVLPEVTFVRRNGDARLVGVAPVGLGEDAARSYLEARLVDVSRELERVAAGRAEDALGGASGLASVDVLDGPDRARAKDTAGAPVALTVQPDDGSADYEVRVSGALDAIAANALEKVIVARSERWLPNSTPDAVDLLESLAVAYPNGFRFCVQPAGGPAFVGASPERLVKVEDRIVHADALAGTAARASDPEEDDDLGSALFASPKERREHQAVVGYLHDQLQPMVPRIEAAAEPRLLKLAHVQHLHTPFRGRLSDDDAGKGVLELASRVHPTPAVAGVPTAQALDWLQENEDLDRGWYAGGVGTVAPRGEGEFCVAIRSALLVPGEVRLYAGAGIVEGSVPARERAETEQKLRGLLEALAGQDRAVSPVSPGRRVPEGGEGRVVEGGKSRPHA